MIVQFTNIYRIVCANPSPTPTATFSWCHGVQTRLELVQKYASELPHPTASAVWMFCCADIQTTNKRRGMQQDLRVLHPFAACTAYTKAAHFRPRITIVPSTAAHMVRYTTLSGMSPKVLNLQPLTHD